MKIECKNFEMTDEQLIKPVGFFARFVQSFRPVITKSRVICDDVTFNVEPADYNQMTLEQKGRFFGIIANEVEQESKAKTPAVTPKLAPNGSFNESQKDVVVPMRSTGRGRHVKAVDITDKAVELLKKVNVTAVSNKLGIPRSTFVNWYTRKRMPAKRIDDLIKAAKLDLYVENGFLKVRG